MKCFTGCRVAVDVLSDLRSPEVPVGLGEVATIAGVPMPETAVDKQRNAMLRQHQIGSAGKVFWMKSKAISKPVEK